MASTRRIRNSNELNREVEPDPDPGTQTTTEPNPDEDEFKITVKKLEVAVRPRGVLAE
jgi:hypothetical protein